MKGIRVIFDGNANAYRANCVVELATKQGFRTSAIIGTLNIIHSTVETLTKMYEVPVREVIFVWDKGRSPRRMEVFSDYKANRKKEFTPEDKQWMEDFYKQTDVLHENLQLFGIKSYRKDHWEGDDLVLGFTTQLSRRYPEDVSIIISTDEDFHQLISDTVHIFSPIKRILYTPENYKSITGISPELFLTYKILKGDSSDGIPGISGIGEKTAKSLVNTYGDLEGLLDHRDELVKSKRFAKIFTAEGLSILDRNNKLINLKDYVDLVPVTEDIDDILDEEPVVDHKLARDFLMKYQLVSLLVKYATWIDLFDEVANNFYEANII